jgi:precorrin-6B methylase 1
VNRELGAALKRSARRAGENSQSVRGSRLMLATVTDVLTGGLVEVDGDMEVKRLASYTTPADGDLVCLADFGDGNWLVLGKIATT